jgi:hypothetical protein
MNEQKMTAKEWHDLAATSLAEANEKILGKFVDRIQADLLGAEKREAKRYEQNLRDSFAMYVISGLNIERYRNDEIGDVVYSIADLLLQARSKRNIKEKNTELEDRISQFMFDYNVQYPEAKLIVEKEMEDEELLKDQFNKVKLDLKNKIKQEEQSILADKIGKS